jgi:hypothetical protein
MYRFNKKSTQLNFTLLTINHMKKKFLLLLLAASTYSFVSRAQDTIKTTGDSPLVLYGSVDAYYKDDFSGHNNIGFPSAGYTYYANEQNSVSLGMVDIGLKKKVGKASFVGELSFGPRSDASLPVPNNHIENLYLSYDVTDKFNLTAGYMATFVGYEVISPTGNFNYSTSYLFSAGPFQNAGLKATYAFSDKVSLMAGIFNDKWNVYTAEHDVSTFGAQLTVTPVKNWTAYVNLLSGPSSGTIIDLTTSYQITNAFKLGLNAADYTKAHVYDEGEPNAYEGVALYPQYAVSKAVTLGLRAEYFEFKAVDPDPAAHITEATLTANIKSGPLTFIPEVRLDSWGKLDYSSFTNSSGEPTKSASQFVLAAVYAF